MVDAKKATMRKLFGILAVSKLLLLAFVLVLVERLRHEPYLYLSVTLIACLFVVEVGFVRWVVEGGKSDGTREFPK